MSSEPSKVLVVTPEQLRDGYVRNPHIRLGENVVRTDRAAYRVIRELDDGNYLVEDPE